MVFKNYFVLFHQSKVRLCLSPAWLQHQVRSDCPAQLRTKLHQDVLTQMLHLTSTVCKGKRASILQAEKYSWNSGLEGTYITAGKGCYRLPRRAAPCSQPRFASVPSSGFSSSQPGGFLRLHTPGAWHLWRRELHLTETLQSSFLMCPVYKPSIPGSKMSL